MKSPIALILFFSLALYTSGTNARKDPGEYWRAVMKDEPMPDAIQRLMPQHSSVPLFKEKIDCDHTSPSVGVAKDSNKSFEPRPNVSVYHDDTKLKENKSKFEPRPNVSVYHDDTKLKENKSNFEPRPNVSVYRDDDIGLKHEKPFAGDLEPRPNVSVYHD